MHKTHNKLHTIINFPICRTFEELSIELYFRASLEYNILQISAHIIKTLKDQEGYIIH